MDLVLLYFVDLFDKDLAWFSNGKQWNVIFHQLFILSNKYVVIEPKFTA